MPAADPHIAEEDNRFGPEGLTKQNNFKGECWPGWSCDASLATLLQKSPPKALCSARQTCWDPTLPHSADCEGLSCCQAHRVTRGWQRDERTQNPSAQARAAFPSASAALWMRNMLHLRRLIAEGFLRRTFCQKIKRCIKQFGKEHRMKWINCSHRKRFLFLQLMDPT